MGKGGSETAFLKFRDTRNFDEFFFNFAKFRENKIIDFREIIREIPFEISRFFAKTLIYLANFARLNF